MNLPEQETWRGWQRDAFDRIATRLADPRPVNIKIAVAPASGKTFFGLLLGAYLMWDLRLIDTIYVVCPTLAVRDQWIDEARKVGLTLASVPDEASRQMGMRLFSNDKHGLVLTYAAVTHLYEVLRTRTGRERVLVIFDEFHHLADDAAWGECAERAFQAAPYRLFESGTAFRTDGRRFPFGLNRDNAIGFDYEYHYGRAVRDGYCRETTFKFFDADLDWLETATIEVVTRKLSQVKSPRERRKVWREIIRDRKSQWLSKLFETAHSDLMDERQSGYTRAARLVICRDIEHAEMVCEVLQEVTKTTPVVVHSALANAQALLKDFSTGDTPWLIAVDMVSEGVDIPRISGIVWLTGKLTMLYFYQILGRAWRIDLKTPPVPYSKNASCTVYLPAIQPLVPWALRIKTDSFLGGLSPLVSDEDVLEMQQQFEDDYGLFAFVNNLPEPNEHDPDFIKRRDDFITWLVNTPEQIGDDAIDFDTAEVEDDEINCADLIKATAHESEWVRDSSRYPEEHLAAVRAFLVMQGQRAPTDETILAVLRLRYDDLLSFDLPPTQTPLPEKRRIATHDDVRAALRRAVNSLVNQLLRRFPYISDSRIEDPRRALYRKINWLLNRATKAQNRNLSSIDQLIHQRKQVELLALKVRAGQLPQEIVW